MKKELLLLMGLFVCMLLVVFIQPAPAVLAKVAVYGVLAAIAYQFYAFTYHMNGLAMASLFGCGVEVPRRCDDCIEGENNRIIHTAFVEKVVSIPTTSAAAAQAAILAAELAGTAIIIRNTNGTKAAPTVKTGKGAGKQVERNYSKDHVIDVIDFNYVNNVPFWNALEDRASNYKLYYFTSTKMWASNPTALSVAAMDPITDDISTEIEATFQVKWSQKGNPIPYSFDTSVLEACRELFDYEEVGGFFNASGSQASIVDTEISSTTSENWNIKLEAGAPLATVYVVDGALPLGLTLSYSGEVVTIAGTPTETGVFTPTIRAANASGVAGEFTLTITITA